MNQDAPDQAARPPSGAPRGCAPKERDVNRMEKRPFLTEAQVQDILPDVPTPFHIYDEKGIRENARRINQAFSWNKGFKEYFAV